MTKLNALKRGFPRARGKLLVEIGEAWIELVRESRWEGGQAPSTSSIIARKYGSGFLRIHLGWKNYEGSAKASRVRLNKRKKLFNPTIKKILKGFNPIPRY